MEDQGPEESRASSARGRGSEPERAALLAAVLELAGEVGYRRLTVERLAERAGLAPGEFHSRFSDLEECFTVAYSEQAEALLEAVLEAGAAPAGWTEGLRGALAELVGFATEERTTAEAILTQVYVAGGRAQLRHQESLERLARALDRSRREGEAPRSPPPGTARFMVGAIEETVRWRLEQRRPEELWGELPELSGLIVAAYRGEEAGRAERRRPAPGRPHRG
jgi:AcrR family transcriptional regulator